MAIANQDNSERVLQNHSDFSILFDVRVFTVVISLVSLLAKRSGFLRIDFYRLHEINRIFSKFFNLSF
jgi:hypothetical protein